VKEVYGYAGRIENFLKKRKGSAIDEQSKNKILAFYHECLVRGYSKARTIKYLYTLEKTAALLTKPLVEVKKEDIVDLVEKIEERNYPDWTKHDYKVIIKVFFRWLRNTESYPAEVN